MITRVNKRKENDCAICCLAMITGYTYELVESELSDRIFNGLSLAIADQYLAERGYAVSRLFRLKSSGTEFQSRWPVLPFADLHWCVVQVYQESTIKHSVLMLKDGTVIDPHDNEKLSLYDYYKVYSIAGIYRIS